MKRFLLARLASIVLCICFNMIASLTISAGGTAHATALHSTSSCRTLRFSPGTLVMHQGDELHASSCKGTDIKLRYQDDGNLVLSIGGVPKWGTGTVTDPDLLEYPDHVSFQSDGNLVVYSMVVGHITPEWGSGTDNRGSEMDLQSDGNLVIYHFSSRAKTPLFASNTCCVP